jgi:hypothetical protein
VVVEVNGSQSTLPPYGAATVGGYYVAIGQSVQTVAATQCPDYFGPGFAAAAAKVPAGRSAP